MGWPLHIDGAVRQRCVHRDTTPQELDDLLSEYDMKRDLVEINRKAPQWAHKAVWNKWHKEPKTGFTLHQMWIDSELDITQKTTRSSEVRDSDFFRGRIHSRLPTQFRDARQRVPRSTRHPRNPDSPTATGSLAQRANEEWERWRKKTVAI